MTAAKPSVSTLSPFNNFNGVTERPKFHLRGNSLFQNIGRLFLKKQDEWVSNAEGFCKRLDRLEIEPVVFDEMVLLIRLRKNNYHSFFEEAEKIRLSFNEVEDPQHRFHLNLLARKVIGLKYRIEQKYGGIDPLTFSSVTSQLVSQIEEIATHWKRLQKIIVHQELTPRDQEKIRETCTYPEFAKLLLQDKLLQKEYFTWILRDKCPVGPFIEFPATTSRIKSAHLGVRIGRFGEEMFQILKQDMHKILVLPFNTPQGKQFINILDESLEVELNEGLKLTIKKVIDCFAHKNKEIGDLEFFETRGIMNWNSHQFGSKDPLTDEYKQIDLTSSEWWQHLPVFQILTKEAVEKKCGDRLTSGQWVAFAKGSRQTHDLDFDGRHGYLEIAIPVKDTHYVLLSFGKFAATYPQTSFELLSFLLNTVPSKVAYPDENLFYTHREHASVAFQLTPHEGLKLMDYVREELIKSRKGRLFFQFAAENCGYWVQSVLNKVKSIPNLFKLHLLESRPSNLVIGGLFKFYRLLPKFCQSILISITDFFLGSFRGIYVSENGLRAFKSVMTHPLRKEQSIYQVGYLHEQIREKKLKGVIDNVY